MLNTASQCAAVLGAIALLWMGALMVPGPDFLLVIRISIVRGRVAAMRAALGVAIGIALWAVAGFFGIRALFVASPWLYLAFKIGGGGYLLFLGVRLLVSSFRREVAADQGTAVLPATRPFWIGFATNLSNPKAPLFVSSLFAATLPSAPDAALGIAAVCLMFALTLGWYVVVARLLTIRRVSDAFARARRWIDRAAGLAFVGFGARLVLERSD
jgi:threonine/homoserine/homoserine lactone efflux protein